jgi:hypothetical protein
MSKWQKFSSQRLRLQKPKKPAVSVAVSFCLSADEIPSPEPDVPIKKD